MDLHRNYKYMNRKEIEQPEDIKVLIDAFYARVRTDDLLKPVFESRIPDDQWPEHLHVLYQFWEAVILGRTTFRNNPFPKHIGLGITSYHFDRWIKLFHETIDAYFTGIKANDTKENSLKMRALFESKLKSIDDTGMRPLI